MGYIINPYIFAASPSSPTPIAWFKADAITGLSDGDPVSTWTNYGSGSGLDVTAVTTDRPIYKTGIINGLPTVRFDGTDDIMGSGSDVIFSTGCTIFAVGKVRAVKNFNGIMRISTGAGGNSKLEVYWNNEAGGSGSPLFIINRGTGNINILQSFAASPPIPAEDTYYIGCWNNTGSTMNQFMNGGSQLSGSPTGSVYTFSDGLLFIGRGYHGGASFLDGDIAELKIYSPALTTDEINAEFVTLDSKYAIY